MLASFYPTSIHLSSKGCYSYTNILFTLSCFPYQVVQSWILSIQMHVHYDLIYFPFKISHLIISYKDDIRTYVSLSISWIWGRMGTNWGPTSSFLIKKEYFSSETYVRKPYKIGFGNKTSVRIRT